LTISAELPRRATAGFVFSHPAHAIAFGFGVGLAPVAPGTFGTLLAFPLHAAVAPRLGPQLHVLLLVALFVVGVWACQRTGRDLGVHDHGGMVWDETVAFLLVLFLTPPGLVWQAFAFLLFRLFDIFKPMPIRHFDRSIRNGAGVMLDDLVAAFYALLCLAAWKALFG
jgi:phosphatidylglycerophosphatase A